MCVRYFGQWEMLAVSLSAVAFYYGTDFVIPGFHQRTMLVLAYKTPVDVTKGVTDEEGAIRGHPRGSFCASPLFWHFRFGSIFSR